MKHLPLPIRARSYKGILSGKLRYACFKPPDWLSTNKILTNRSALKLKQIYAQILFIGLGRGLKERK